jgi:transcriptional activator of cad operon
MAVLVLLIERRGQVVTRDALIAEVWRGAHVAPGAIARSLSLLRRALDDDSTCPSYIETLPKRGYRLIAAVSMHEAAG